MDDLLDTARISQGKMELRKKVIDVAEFIERAVDSSRSSVEGRQHQLTVSIPMRPLLIKGDATRMEQVVTNLLNNATKYTETGGQIRVNAEKVGTQVVKKSGMQASESIPKRYPIYSIDLCSQSGVSIVPREDWDWA